MVSNEELLNLANETVKKLYEEFQKYNKYTQSQTKEDILIQEFENNLIFEEFFQDLISARKNKKNWYKKYIASYAVVIIENKQGKISINELVDIFTEYAKEEDESLTVIEETEKEEEKETKNIDPVVFEDEEELGIIIDGEFHQIDEKYKIPELSIVTLEQKPEVVISQTEIMQEKEQLLEIRKQRKNNIFQKRKKKV